MNRTEMESDPTVAMVPKAAGPRIRVVVNRLPGTKDWRPGVAPRLDLVIEADPAEASTVG